MEMFWTVREVDLGLVWDALERVEGLGGALRLFVTGTGGEAGGLGRVDKEGVLGRVTREGGVVWERRMERGDLVGAGLKGRKWLLCAGKGLRGRVLEWLEGETVEFEDFDF